ncbi:hypothetical protein [Mangrovimonas sp. TPBH4]|uniref:hypothetical protein n=1 Tax=Mangrovimonas sp. TPBH4 TaxID=1645914 RepID=UPI0006B40ECA|nr:hypothetical protein [Mangrovimonas sp. TPBH4]
MTFFDALFYSAFNHIKTKHKTKATRISTIYLTIVQCSFLLFLGVFFSEFLNQMRVNTMSSYKAWTLFGILAIILYFKNWIQYSGKKRRVKNAKVIHNKIPQYSIWILCLLPIGVLFVSILLLKVL